MNLFSSNQSNHARIEDHFNRASQWRDPSWKRFFDCTLVVVAAPVWLVLGALVASWVKLVSPGPALFRQERIGRMGARFLCLKFRTMAVNADPRVHREHLINLMTSNRPMNKLDAVGDSRLIPGGLWLRMLGLDELPQVLNVLRGEMSLVGPRPCTAYEFEMYQAWQRRRCETLPGLTGLWQVNGKNRTTFEKMMELDIAYVENKSFFLDAKILAATLPAIVLQVRDIGAGRRTESKAGSAEIIERVLPRISPRE
jgi:lipopolysaccharide/colanic/teichoic acid biosynthesis glycosyltransferase